jgi:hypothetical protein
MIHYQTWPPQAILVSDWPISPPLKPLSQMPSDAKSPHCLWQGELKRLIDA